jgi:hypothetical protein
MSLNFCVFALHCSDKTYGVNETAIFFGLFFPKDK